MLLAPENTLRYATSLLPQSGAAMSILAGGKQKPTPARCLDLFLEDRGRGKNHTHKVWTAYEGERRRVLRDLGSEATAMPTA
jgi:hypothetical protein